MNDIKLIDSLVNSWAFGGENIPDGLKQGPSVSPGVTPGIPTGMVHPSYFTIFTPTTISEFTTTTGIVSNTNIQFYLAPAASSGMNKVVEIQESVMALQLYESLSLNWTSTVAISGTWFISGFDRYYRQLAFQRTYSNSTGANFNHGIKFVTNAYFVPSASLSTAVAITLNLSNLIELPYTDYGFAGNFINLVGNQSSTDAAFPQYVVKQAFPNYSYFQNNFKYIPATWKSNITPTKGRPRPLIDPTVSNTSIFGKYFIGMQLLYGFNNTPRALEQFAGAPDLSNTWDPSSGLYGADTQPQFGATEQSIYGRANNIIGWKGWVG